MIPLLHRTTLLAALVIACSLASTGAESADAPKSLTLRKIRESALLSIGYRDASVPFSYLDDRQRPIGYSMDICRHIAASIKRHLGLREMEVRYVPVTHSTRIPLVVNGAVDLECGVTTNNVERQQQVAFTVTTFVSASRLASKRSSRIASLADLRGKPVVSTVGTTSVRYLPNLNTHHGLNVKILAAKDDLEAFRMIETDRAVAFAMDDVLLNGMIASTPNPKDYVISNETLSVEPYGVMLSKADPEFKKIADAAIVELFRSGEIHAIYSRWFQSPIPPRGINLNLPMSAQLKKVIAKPTDSGRPEDYR